MKAQHWPYPLTLNTNHPNNAYVESNGMNKYGLLLVIQTSQVCEFFNITLRNHGITHFGYFTHNYEMSNSRNWDK